MSAKLRRSARLKRPTLVAQASAAAKKKRKTTATRVELERVPVQNEPVQVAPTENDVGSDHVVLPQTILPVIPDFSGAGQSRDTMATSGDRYCKMCFGNFIKKTAEHWCLECEEGFCSEYINHHRKLKLTTDHHVISIDNYKQLPPSLPKLIRYCDVHDTEFDIYCTRHECLCCPICAITTHEECTGLMSTLVSLETMESALINIDKYMEKAQTDREFNMANIVEQDQKFHEEIQKIRSTINLHLDEIEKKMHSKVNAEAETAKYKIQDSLQKIAENRDKVKVLQQNLVAVKKYGSDIQTFLWSRTLETELFEQEQFIKSLEQNGSLKQINLHLEIDTRISDLSSIPVFGSISTRVNPQVVVLKTERDKQAQIMAVVGSRSKKIKNINVTLKSNFNVPQGIKDVDVTGSSICSNGKMIFADCGNNRLVIMNYDGALYKEITITNIGYGPYDVSNIDDTAEAVTLCGRIQIIDLDTKKVKEDIKTENYCYGVVHQGGYLFWCEAVTGIQMLELSSKKKSNIVGQEAVTDWSYIAAYNDKLYVTKMDTNTVTCYSTKGEMIWECISPSVRRPRCITVDNDSNVYVASGDNNSIIIISPDGKECQTLVDLTDIEGQMWGISFDKVKHNLIVSFTDGKVFIYRV